MPADKLTVAVVGASGYTGAETLRWCFQHPALTVVGATSRQHDGKTTRDVWPQLPAVPVTAKIPPADVLFLCLPHGQAALLAPGLSADIVIDLSGDHRLPSSLHARHYEFPRETPEWIYGLPELGAERLLRAKRIANPGCFATALTLALLPLSGKVSGRIQATGLTGSTGSGVTPGGGTHHPQRAENLRPYKVLCHQHVPEVERAIGDIQLDFVPISAPIRRGILVSLQLPRVPASLWHEFYAGNPLVRVIERPPEILHVLGSPRADIGVVETPDATVVFCAIDNLCRGAGSQAVSNLNLSMGWPIDLGLTSLQAVP